MFISKGWWQVGKLRVEFLVVAWTCGGRAGRQIEGKIKTKREQKQTREEV
jgi:hypothetical protein